jgi:hypothetical protein
MISRDNINNLKQFLLDNNIDNERILKKINNLTTNVAIGKFKSDLNNKLLIIKKIVLDNQSELNYINLEIKVILSSIDILSNKEIKKRLLLKTNFRDYQNRCKEVLENNNINKITINAIMSSKSYEQIDQILNEFSFAFLKENNLLYKEIKEENWFTKKSIRHISTRM